MVTNRMNRRAVLKSAGAAGIAGLAGCTGSEGGDGDGDGGGGGNGGTTVQESQPTTLKVNQPPWGVWSLVINYLEENGILENKFDAAGAELDLQRTWESPPLFASEQIDIGALSHLELAQIGAERGIDTVYAGNTLDIYQACMTYVGSGYEVAETGSPQASWDKLVEDNARYIISGWDSATPQSHRIVIENDFGYQFSEDAADVRVVTADLFAIAGLLAEEKAEVADLGVIDGGIEDLMSGDVYSPIYMIQDKLLDRGLGRGSLPLNGIGVRKEALDTNPEAVHAYVEAFDEGYAWLHENVDSIASDSETVEILDVPQNQEQTRFLLDLIVKADTSDWDGVSDLLELDYSPIPERVSFESGFEDESRSFLSTIQEFGIVPSGWDDHMEYLQE